MRVKYPLIRQNMKHVLSGRSLSTGSTSPTRQYGFAPSCGVNWSDYVRCRPAYPPSFFKAIFAYHSERPSVSWAVAHDTGAGCGILSASLASRFHEVIVSDPNEGYIPLARKLLVEQSSSPKRRFRFLQECAEKSSAQSGSVNLIAACECIYWTDIDAAIGEFHRELQPHGSLVITHYSPPLIIGNEGAQKAWYAILRAHGNKSQGLLRQCFPVMNSGLDCLGFPKENWYDVRRIYINTRGNRDAFKLSDHPFGESKVQKCEGRVWVENEQGWVAHQGFDWFKQFFVTLRWPFIPASESKPLWDSLEEALDNQQVKIEVPVVMIMARKQA